MLSEQNVWLFTVLLFSEEYMIVTESTLLSLWKYLVYCWLINSWNFGFTPESPKLIRIRLELGVMSRYTGLQTYNITFLPNKLTKTNSIVQKLHHQISLKKAFWLLFSNWNNLHFIIAIQGLKYIKLCWFGQKPI